MKGKHHGVDFECSSRKHNGKFAGEYLLIFRNGQDTYVIKKSVGRTFPTPKEAEIEAMELAKYQIEKALF